jgi:hypothetical protein
MIIKSFKSAGIATATDGSKDGLITCLHNQDLTEEVHKQSYSDRDNSSREFDAEDQGNQESGPLVVSDSESDFEGFIEDSLLL